MRKGFTLIELLVAMALLALVMLAVTQMMNSTRIVTATSGKRMAAEAEARTVFDRMSGDFARMVKRADVDYSALKQSGNDAFYFFSESPAYASANGTASNQNPVSLVGYRINAASQLERLGKGLTWNEVQFLAFPDSPVTNSSVPVSGSTIAGAFGAEISQATNAAILADNVFRMEITFLLKPFNNSDGTYLPATYSDDPWDTRAGHSCLTGIGLSDVQTIVVTLAILDPSSRKILPPGTDFSKAVEALQDNTNLSKLPSQVWQETINNNAFAIDGFPASAARQVRIFQRAFPINTQ